MPSRTRSGELYTVDIGSTVLKFARVDVNGKLVHQEFHDRDFDAEIIDQVDKLLAPHGDEINGDNLLICSSANGGLRVGIVCLSNSFSGSTYRNQVLLGGANPVYVDEISNSQPRTSYVDVLLVGGGIDCEDVGPMDTLITRFSPDNYNFGTLVFAGNRFLAEEFVRRFGDARVVRNPMAGGLTTVGDSIFVALRDAYLDDLVYKQGVSELAAKFGGNVRPTPEVVNRGFYKAISEREFPEMTGASILMDIGGATTDFHYTVEVIRDSSSNRPAAGTSVSRYVFTDLGVYASRDSTALQLRRNPRTFEFLEVVLDSDVSEVYRLLREGEYEPPAQLLSYACVFLSLDRFSQGNGPGLPTADLVKLNKLVLTGGAAQMLDRDKTAAVISLFLPAAVDAEFVMIDENYELWVQGAISHQRTRDQHGSARKHAVES